MLLREFQNLSPFAHNCPQRSRGRYLDTWGILRFWRGTSKIKVLSKSRSKSKKCLNLVKHSAVGGIFQVSFSQQRALVHVRNGSICTYVFYQGIFLLPVHSKFPLGIRFEFMAEPYVL